MKYVSSHINYRKILITFVTTIRVAILIDETTKWCKWNYSVFDAIVVTLSGSQYSLWQIVIIFVLFDSYLGDDLKSDGNMSE
jgi:hypothetical protein